MPRKGRKLEQLIAMLEEILGPQGIIVTSPDYIKGRLSGNKREVDISLRSRIGSSEVLVIIECRDRQGTEDVRWIEEVATKRKDVGADKAIAVSSTGFSSGARQMADNEGIELRTYEEVKPDEIALWFGFDDLVVFNRKSNIEHVTIRLVPDEDASIEFPPEVRSKLFPVFDFSAKIFRRKQDGSLASFDDAWWSCDMNSLFHGIELDKPRVKRRVRLNFAKDEDRFQIITSSGDKDIALFEVYCELWVEKENRPLTSVQRYRNGDKVIAKSAGFQFENRDQEFILELHKIEESGDQFITVRRKNEAK